MTAPVVAHPPIRRPGRLLNALVSMSVRLLPRPHRPRYDTEWRSELFYTALSRRLVTALSQARGALPLAHELRFRPATGVSMTKRKDWRCVLGFHKYVRHQPVHMSGRLDYWWECARCRRFRNSTDGNAIASGFGSGGWV